LVAAISKSKEKPEKEKPKEKPVPGRGEGRGKGRERGVRCPALKAPDRGGGKKWGLVGERVSVCACHNLPGCYAAVYVDMSMKYYVNRYVTTQ